MKATIATLLLAASAPLLLANVQAAEEWQRFAGEATVNVIEVPVQVIDPATGKAVAGLEAGDFKITEDGVEQRITHFAEISTSSVVQPGTDGVPPDQRDAAVAPKGSRLEMVYFFDLYLMYQHEYDRALQGLRDRYRGGVSGGESVSLVAFDGMLETFLDRSDHRDDVLDALEELGDLTARGPQQTIAFTRALTTEQVSGSRDTDFYERRNRSREYVFELENKIRKVGQALLATMARYGRAQGRKVLVAFTPGYPRTEWSPEYSPVDYLNASTEYPTERIWEEVANQAADLGFTVYTVDSSGFSVAGSADQSLLAISDSGRLGRDVGRTTAADSGAESTAVGRPTTDDPSLVALDPNAPNSLGRWLERNRKDLLISAARTTGGEALFVGEVSPALETVSSALDRYYSLAFTADHMGDGRTHRLEVEVLGHPGYRLVHRTTYVDQPASVRSGQRLRSRMLFGEDANPLAVRVEVGAPQGRFRIGAAGSKRVKVPLYLKIPYARLEMVPRGDVYWGKVVVTFFGQDGKGNQSELANFAQPITIAADLYQEAVAKGYYGYEVTIEVEGGRQLVYVGIEDTISGRTSIVPQEFAF